MTRAALRYEYPSRVATPDAARAELHRLKRSCKAAADRGDTAATTYLQARIKRVLAVLAGVHHVDLRDEA